MSDTLARLLAALEALERDTPHSKLCDTIHWGDARCDCDYDVRRRLAIAQRMTDAATFSDEALEAAEAAAVAAGNGRTNGLAYDLTDAARGERYALLEIFVAVFASPGRDT